MNATSASKIELPQAVEMLKAIAHPIRLSVIDLLNTKGKAMCVTEIHEELQIEQAVVSQHLKILKEKGVLDYDKEGKHCFYYIKNKGLNNLLNCIRNCQSC
jgi:ArsR family transcriptional regulator